MCAARSAIFNAISNDEKEILEVGISCLSDGDSSSSMMPCGACRQVFKEFAEGSAKIHVDQVGTFELADLLPEPFYLK